MLTWSPLYSNTYTTSIQSIPWPFMLFNLIVSTSTRYHYTCRFNNVVEAREDVRCLLESFIFSGGLFEYDIHWLFYKNSIIVYHFITSLILIHSFVLTIRESSSSSSFVSNPVRNFLQAVYENDLDEYAIIHTWLDLHHPEPAWRRKRSPINVFFELKYFTSLVYLCGRGQLLMDCFRQLVGRILLQ